MIPIDPRTFASASQIPIIDAVERARSARRVVCIIQARLGSSRFPRKVLADLNGKPVLQHVIERAKAIVGVDEVVVAYPCDPDHDKLVRPIAHESGASVAAPNVNDADVLGRFAEAARFFEADVVLRVTGDCPLLDPAVSSLVLARFFEEHADFCSNDVNESGYPDGLDTEVFTRALLERADAEATNPYDREHVTPWMKRAAGVRVTLVKKPGAFEVSREKLSIDTKEDLARVQNMLDEEADGRFCRTD